MCAALRRRKRADHHGDELPTSLCHARLFRELSLALCDVGDEVLKRACLLRVTVRVCACLQNLHNIIDCSNLNELYDQWTDARLEILNNRLKSYKQALANRRRRLEARDGVLGGLREPTVDIEEFRRLTEEVVSVTTVSCDLLGQPAPPDRSRPSVRRTSSDRAHGQNAERDGGAYRAVLLCNWL